jgi:phage tail protein X
MSVTLKAKHLTHTSQQGEIWDIIAWREYGDEHAMSFIQDANFDQRFVDAFPYGIVLALPPTVTLQNNLKTRKALPDLKQLLPWL